MLIDRIKEEYRVYIDRFVDTYPLQGADITRSLKKDFVNDLTVYEALILTSILGLNLNNVYEIFNDL